MIFMNEMDIRDAPRRYGQHNAVKLKACNILIAHMEAINSCSDGWAYWSPPVKAAQRLMELIQSPPSVSEVIAADYLSLAMRPLRAFYTKHPQVPRPGCI